ncbi:MAG: DUF4838 domain-containing protein [Armatimonadota bacterium]
MRTTIALVLAVICALPAAAMDLTVDGAANCVIVLPDDAMQIHQFPAEELAEHLQAISGAEIAIVRESEQTADPGHRIYVGPTQAAAAAGIDAAALEPEAIRILAGGDDLFILGGDRLGPGDRDDPHSFNNQVGTLYAVYDLLQDQLGVRWLWPGETGTVIPDSPTVSVGEIDIHEAPQLKQRKLRTGIRSSLLSRIEHFTGPLDRTMSGELANDQNVWLRRMRMGRSLFMNYGHAFTRWWERFGEEHPEYFALYDGAREPAGNADRVKMCVAEPALWDAVIADWKAKWEENPVAYQTLNACENDGGGFCECEKCAAWDVPEYTEDTPEGPRVILSDRYAKFWNQLATRLREVDEDAYVATYAYSRYRFPPRETTLEPNIIVGFVPAVGYPNSGARSEQFREDWLAWHDQATMLFLRPNWLGSLHTVPRAPLHQMAEDFKFAARNGMIGTDFDSLSGQWLAQGPVYYLLARLHWDTEASTDAILDEYYSAFGAAAPKVAEYFDYWNEYITSEWPKWTDVMYELGYRNMARGAERIIPYIYTDEAFAPARDILMHARKIALDEPEIVRTRVDQLLQALRHAEMTSAAIAATERINSGETEDLAHDVDIIRRMHSYRMAIGKQNVINPYWAMWRDTKTGDYAGYGLVRDIGDRQAVKLLPLKWYFRFDPDEVGENEEWYALRGSADGWASVRTDMFWEDQGPGKAWEAEHDRQYDGWGWYRTSFDVDPQYEGRKLVLFFTSVDEDARIWLNGEFVEDHPMDGPDGWKTPFTVDVTDHLRFDGNNHLAVAVHDSAGKGGIYKRVWMMEETGARK